MTKTETSRTAQGAGAAEENRKSDILHTVSNFSLYIEQSIIMPPSYGNGKELHIGVIEEGIFNANSEDICLVAQIKDNIFRAAIGDKTMYCILLSGEEAKQAEQRGAHSEDYEMAAKLRDAQSVFIYRNDLSALLNTFGFRLEDCEFLFTVRVSQDSKSGYSSFDLTGDTEMRIDSYELWNLLTGSALELARKGDSDSIEALSTNLTSLNKLSNGVLAYLLFLKGLVQESKGHNSEAKEIYAEAIKLEPSIEQYINQPENTGKQDNKE